MPPAHDLSFDEAQARGLATEILARAEYARFRQLGSAE
jgi:hypothetical protein